MVPLFDQVHIYKYAMRNKIKRDKDGTNAICIGKESVDFQLRFKLMDFKGNEAILNKDELVKNLEHYNLRVPNLLVTAAGTVEVLSIFNVDNYEQMNKVIHDISCRAIKSTSTYAIGNMNIGYFVIYDTELLDYIGNCNEITIPNVEAINKGFLAYNKSVTTVNILSFIKLIEDFGAWSALKTIRFNTSYNDFRRINFRKPNEWDKYTYTSGGYNPIREDNINIQINNKDIPYYEFIDLLKIAYDYSSFDKLREYFKEEELPRVSKELQSFDAKSKMLGYKDYEFDIRDDDGVPMLWAINILNPTYTNIANVPINSNTMQLPPVVRLNRLKIREINLLSQELEALARQLGIEYNFIKIYELLMSWIEESKIKTLILPNTLEDGYITTKKIPHIRFRLTGRKINRTRAEKIRYYEPIFKEVVIPSNVNIIFDSYMRDTYVKHGDKSGLAGALKVRNDRGIGVKVVSIKNMPNSKYSEDSLPDTAPDRITRAITIETNPKDRRIVDAVQILEAVAKGQVHLVNADVYYDGNIIKK